jgi:hypothetical protein
MAPDHDVLQGGHVGEQADVLESPGEPPRHDLVRLEALHRRSGQENLAGGHRIQPGHAVEQGGLAGAVGADQAVDLALAHAQGNIVQGGEAAKALGDVGDNKQVGHGQARAS